MGHTPSLLTNKLHNQWTYIDTLGHFQIFKNQLNQLAQKHIVKCDPKIDENDYITAYSQRYLPAKPIVSAYDAEFQHKSTSMCQNSSVMTVFTEFIPYRLSDVKTLNHGQGIYVLSEALAGFAQLFARVGPFQIHDDLIGFNQDGEVKVWYNANFADNSVDNDRIILMSTVNPYDFDRKFSQNQENDMVQDTINAVARYTKFNPQFLYQAQGLKKTGFAQARRVISNEVARKAYYVPDHLLLSDKNGIIKRSGVEPKHRSVVNHSSLKTGQSYPYFVENQQGQQGQSHLQGQTLHQNYQVVDDNDSESSSNENNLQGHYNLNGQNYRVVATRTFEGNNIPEQQIIQEVLRNNPPAPLQSHTFTQDPHYASVRSQLHEVRPQEQFSQIRKPKYQEGHIIINQSQHSIPSRSNIQYTNVNTEYHPQVIQNNPQGFQKENVRVFSMGENGKLQEESRFGGHSTSQLAYGERVQPHFIPQNRRVIPHEQLVVPVYQTRHTTEVPVQSVRHDFPGQSNVNFQSRHLAEEPRINTTHRHRIFEQSPSGQKNLIREESQVYPQRVF